MMSISKIISRVWERLLWGVLLRPDKPVPPPIPSLWQWFLLHLTTIDHEKRMNRAVLKTRSNYQDRKREICEKKNRGEKIKILFVVTCKSKWKVQSLYDVLVANPHYEPLVGISYQRRYYYNTALDVEAEMLELTHYLMDKGCRCVPIYSPQKDRYLNLREYGPDIVVYTESWYAPRAHHPLEVSRFALTLYIPYYVPNYCEMDIDCRLNIHRFYWKHIVLNQALREMFEEATRDRTLAGTFVALGHPMLDELYLANARNDRIDALDTVIYAPHWTFEHPNHETRLKISTFSENGREILEYAQTHREFNWVFKPHPNLYADLIASGKMTKSEADKYYAAWSELGMVCESSDYFSLFLKSFALITDCGSFLTEYGATKHPIIHLISSRNQMVPPPQLKKVYDTYYQARNLKEMYEIFDLVLKQRKDPKRQERINALEQASLCNVYSAKCIVEYLEKCLG